MGVTTTTTAPAATSVLTDNFPSAMEMVGWVFGKAGGWVSSHPVLTAVVAVGLVLWYFGIIVSRAVRSV